ncbi:MAG: FAD-dependent oxidoreductase [Elusimicrobiota bacterium]|nr:FAD-dependent oxidoreductase [Elusimicrobiota bacterium]
MKKKDFDVIIVGAGPAGLAAAYKLSSEGVKVIVIERGTFPGAKNVMGGIFYRKALEDLIPDFEKTAPLERHIIEQKMWLLSEDSALGGGLRSEKFNKEPYNCYSVFRAKFDKWFAKKAIEAGALIISETVVKEPIVEDGKVIGVKTDRPDGDLYADVVIAADGINSLFTKALGLRESITPDKVALTVKEVIGLPEKVVNDRFGVLNKNEGVTIELTGPFFEGMTTMGFIYTNKASISIGLGAIVEDLVEKKANINDMLEKLKSHPAIKPLIHGGETKEYMAHMIPEGGYFAIPKLYTDGFMVCGDAAMLVNAVHREGSNLAIESGKLAAETYLKLKKAGDFSAKKLSSYQKKMDKSFVMKDLKMYRHLPKMMEDKRQLLTKYPQFAIDAAYDIYNINGVAKIDKIKAIKKRVAKLGYIRMAKDAFDMWRKIR